MSVRSRLWVLAIVCSSAASLVSAPASATRLELVQFESAPRPLGQLQQRLARERGETPKGIAGDTLQGYLAKPEGEGPFPAIVGLHGCGGVRGSFAQAVSERLVSWGYVVLVVDSFATRGIRHACTFDSSQQGLLASRTADAFGALLFLARLSFVDSRRVGVIGYSHGGIAALRLAEARSFELFENPHNLAFRAAVAFYPRCESDGRMAVPTLILIGELDDWTPARGCERMVARRNGEGEPVELVVYPGAHHAFNVPELRAGMRFFGHWLQYDAEADEKSMQHMWEFLGRHLAN